jgi:hypothetical protein
VLVGIGPRQPRRDLGAIDRLRHHAKGVGEHGEIEPREVKNLEHAGIGQEPLQVRRIGRMRRDLHHVGGSISGRELNQAQPVTAERQPHSLGVDRHCAGVAREVRQIAAVQAYGHAGMQYRKPIGASKSRSRQKIAHDRAAGSWQDFKVLGDGRPCRWL